MESSRRSPQSQATIPNQIKSNNTKKSKYSFLTGFLLAQMAAFFLSLDAVVVKSIKNIHPVQLSLYRSIAIFVFCMPKAVKCKENLFGTKDVRIFLVLRGIFGGIAIFLAYTSYQLLPLGESFIITSSVPIFVTLGACICLNEPCGIFQSFLVVLTVSGIIFTTKVPSRLIGNDFVYTTEKIYGILAATGVLLCRTFMILCVRKAKKIHYSVMLFNYGWVAVVEALILLPILTDFKWHTCGVQGFYILLMGLSSYVGQAFLVSALKCDFAGPISTIKASGSIIVSFMWQMFLFHDIPDNFTIIGAVIVVCCIILASIKQWVSSLPKNSQQRKRLKWILA